MPPIYWTEFTWEAFSTLATGLAAVIAAVIVGLRQAGIADRQAGISAQQTKILAKQVALDELKLRSDLFDRRAQVYQCTGRYIEAQITTADVPDVQTRNDFLMAMNSSRFLFNDGVHKSLKEIWDRTGKFGISKSRSNNKYAKERDYGKEDLDLQHAHLTWIAEMYGNLADVFGDEMKLGLKQA